MKRNNELDNIKKLETLASEVLSLKQKYRQRRPIVIEFCGSPKSGKTSCISSLNIFIKRNGFKTQVLTERASICPIPNKHDPFFNIWTFSASIAEMTEKLSLGIDSVDVIIADRGIFDSLSWFQWQRSKRYIDSDNYKSIKDFLTMKMWRRYIDVIYVFKVEPQISMEREYAYLLTRKTGTIMNKKILNEYNKALDKSTRESSRLFKRIEEVDTSKHSQNEVSSMVTSTILSTLKDLLVEKIGYFENHYKELNLSYGVNEISNIGRYSKFKFSDRNIVEDSHYIQPIPIAVLTNKSRDEVLVLKKQEKSLSKDSPEKGKFLIYAGGHIRKEDNLEGERESFLNIAKNTLYREINEELGITIIPENIKPFLIYTPDNYISKKHLAVCFVLNIDFENIKFRLDRREIIQKTGRTKSGRIVAVRELISHNEELESWSRVILDKVFGLKLKADEQLVL